MCASTPDGFEMLGTFHPITTSIQRSALYWPGIDVASVCGSNQQSGAKPAINSTGIYDSGIQLVRDVSAQQRFCCWRPCLHSATVSHAPSEIEERIQMGPWKFPLSDAKSEEITARKTTRLAKAEGFTSTHCCWTVHQNFRWRIARWVCMR